MAKELSYSQQRAQDVTLLTREVLRDLPSVCADFLRAIEPTTQPLTRYAYACDLKLFFAYLQNEVPRFAAKTPADWTCAELGSVTARDVSMYLEYLSLYYKADEAVTNAELGKMRKLSSLRSFYHYLFKNSLINADITLLVDMPSRSFWARASASANWSASTSTTLTLRSAALWSRARAAGRPSSTSRTRWQMY